jgi:hypothetical protein
MQGFTVVEYGDLKISNCLTKEFRQEPVFDESGTDLMYWKFTVRVVGYTHNNGGWNDTFLFVRPVPKGVTSPDSGDAGAAKAHIMQRVRLAPRKTFTMRTGVTASNPDGKILLTAAPHPARSSDLSGLDVNNGPRGTLMAITQITGDNIFRVEAEFEVCKVECDDKGQAQNNTEGVLSNRWSSVDDIDENWYTVRTHQGRLRMASANFSPHDFRNLVVPGIPKGMKRAKMTFVASPDGLALDYTITDREVAFSAPAPATSWAIRHTQSTADEILGVAMIDIELTGDRYVDKKSLVILAYAIIEAKCIGEIVADPNNANGKQYLIEEMSFTDIIGDVSAVHATARVKQMRLAPQGADGRLGNIQFSMGQLGKVIDENVLEGYNYGRSRFSGEEPPLSGPIDLVGLFRCYLQNPCNDEHLIGPEKASTPEGPRDDGDSPEVEAVIADGFDVTDDPYASPEHLEAIYTSYQIESLYHTDYLKAAMPIARETQPYEPGVGGGPLGPDEPTCKVVTLGPGVMKRTLRISGERVGAWPQMPEPADYTDANGVTAHLMEHKCLPGTTRISAIGQKIYRASAEYIYALTRILRPNEQWRVGANPWDVGGLQRINGDSNQLFKADLEPSGETATNLTPPPDQL